MTEKEEKKRKEAEEEAKKPAEKKVGALVHFFVVTGDMIK